MRDPSDIGVQSANTRLLDAILTHAVDLERLKAGEVGSVLAMLGELEADLVRQLATLPRPTTISAEYNRARLEALLQQTAQTIATAYRKVTAQQADTAAQLAGIEARAGAGMIDEGIGIQGSAASVALTSGQLRTLADQTNIVAGKDQAAPLANWWAGQGVNLQDRFAKAIRLGYQQGEDVDALVRRVRGTRAANYTDGVMATSRAQAETLVRTSVQQISNTARQNVLDANRDLCGEVQHHSTLDARTSGVCRERDGKRWTNDDAHAPIGSDLPFRVPPLHPRCRSVLQPLLKSWSELTGGRVRDLSAADEPEVERRFRAALARSGLSQEQQDKALRNTRASMDGQVPDTISYPEWLQRKNAADPGFGKRLLGTKRADLVSRGVISVSEAVSPMTLAQLDAKVKARSASPDQSPPDPASPPARGGYTKPVSEAFTIHLSGDGAEQTRRGLAAIDSVHDDGVLPAVPVHPEPEGSPNLGSYGPGSNGIYEVTLNKEGSWPALTFVHEAGHLLDHRALGGDIERRGTSEITQRGAELVPWFTAVSQTASVQSLRDRLAGATSDASRNYLGYLLRPSELWARAYAQYITEKSNDPVLTAQLKRARAAEPDRQWEGGDFVPVSSAIDELFASLGWSR